MWSQISERTKAQSKCRHHDGNDLARLKSVEEPSHERRTDRHGNGGQAERARYLLPAPAEFLLEGLNHEAEAVNEYRSKSRENADVRHECDAPPLISKALLRLVHRGGFPAHARYSMGETTSSAFVHRIGIIGNRAALTQTAGSLEFLSILRWMLVAPGLLRFLGDRVRSVSGHDPACRPGHNGFILEPEESKVVDALRKIRA